MNTQKLDTLKKLLHDEKELRTGIECYDKVTSDSSCDKHDLSFVGSDSRFSSYSENIILTSYIGYYGDSNCSTFLHVHSTKLLSKALHKHLRTVLEWMADVAEEEAEKLKAQAQAEIDQLQALVDEAVKS